jgi:hypothetical protein
LARAKLGARHNKSFDEGAAILRRTAMFSLKWNKTAEKQGSPASHAAAGRHFKRGRRSQNAETLRIANVWPTVTQASTF